MANSPQAKKRARQGEARRRHNASFRSLVRTSIKKVDSAIETGDHSKASEAYNSAVPIIDRMADKGIINKISNIAKTNRTKSQGPGAF